MKTLALAAGLLAASVLSAQDSSHCGMHDHHADVDSRGDQVMGFDHDKTTHGFRLTPRGGVIEVVTNDPRDKESREAIQTHLAHIAEMFAEGDFEAPLLIHGEQPAGVDDLKRHQKEIRWEYVETEHGGRVVATTENAEAREAIHAFLRFQIEEHRTGDSEDVDEKDGDTN